MQPLQPAARATPLSIDDAQRLVNAAHPGSVVDLADERGIFFRANNGQGSAYHMTVKAGNELGTMRVSVRSPFCFSSSASNALQEGITLNKFQAVRMPLTRTAPLTVLFLSSFAAPVAQRH